MIRERNELQEVARELLSIATFKHELNFGLMKVPTYYFDRKRVGQNYHVRLTTNCSSLNQHLFSKKVTYSPVCLRSI